MFETRISKELYSRACWVIPGGVSSPVRAFRAVGGTPRFINRASGANIWDIDGNCYIDFCGSWGPLILGHANPQVLEAVRTQISNGMSYGAPTEIELELAEYIVGKIDSIEQIRFVSSGTEAVMSAIRLARGATGRNLILKFDGCYHGHSDSMLVMAGSGMATFGQPSSAGVPRDIAKNTAVLPLDDEELLETFFEERGKETAAVIIEGIPANNGLLIQRHGYMRLLRTLTEKYNTMLILDEVITGFRIGFGGAADYYGITPDLITYGKIIGGGLPVGAIAGPREIMENLAPLGKVYQAGTLSGNPIAMAAGLATLKQLSDESVYQKLEEQVQKFISRIMDNLDNNVVDIASAGSIFWIAFQKELPLAAHEINSGGISHYNRIHSQALNQGLYLPPSGYEVCFLSTKHSDEQLADAADKLAELIRSEIHERKPG